MCVDSSQPHAIIQTSTPLCVVFGEERDLGIVVVLPQACHVPE